MHICLCTQTYINTCIHPYMRQRVQKVAKMMDRMGGGCRGISWEVNGTATADSGGYGASMW